MLILVLKYSTAFEASSGAFSWNPYGVSSSVARAGFGNNREIMRCVGTIVGAVSPEPIMTNMRGSVMKRTHLLLLYAPLVQNARGVVHADRDLQD